MDGFRTLWRRVLAHVNQRFVRCQVNFWLRSPGLLDRNWLVSPPGQVMREAKAGLQHVAGVTASGPGLVGRSGKL
jgi:hypothetical protein